jgi:hypothetical protein
LQGHDQAEGQFDIGSCHVMLGQTAVPPALHFQLTRCPVRNPGCVVSIPFESTS